MNSLPQAVDNSFIKKLQSSGRSLIVFYGSQTGTGEEFASRIAKEGAKYGMKGMVADPEECDMVSIRTRTYCTYKLIIELSFYRYSTPVNGDNY